MGSDPQEDQFYLCFDCLGCYTYCSVTMGMLTHFPLTKGKLSMRVGLKSPSIGKGSESSTTPSAFNISITTVSVQEAQSYWWNPGTCWILIACNGDSPNAYEANSCAGGLMSLARNWGSLQLVHSIVTGAQLQRKSETRQTKLILTSWKSATSAKRRKKPKPEWRIQQERPDFHPLFSNM